MRFSLGVCCLSIVLCAVVPSARADSTWMGARVVAVDAKKQRVTIDRGKLAGLKIGDTGSIFPMQPTDDSKDLSVEFDIRVARGKLVELGDKRAVLALDSIAGTVNPGDVFEYELDVPTELARSALFSVIARGIELDAADGTPIVTVEALLADQSQARRDKATDAMVDEIKARRAEFAQFTFRVEHGPHRGKLPVEMVDLVNRSLLTDMLVYIDAFPGREIGHAYRPSELFLRWVANGTSSGEADRKRRLARPAFKAAYDDHAAGKFDDARAKWRAILTTIPGDKEAAGQLSRIDRILVLQRQVAADADDTAARFKLMEELYDASANALAMDQYAILLKARYDRFKIDVMRGKLLARQDKWTQSAELFKQLAKQKPDDATVKVYLRRGLIEAKLAKSPGDAAALLQLAEATEDEKRWGDALEVYRKVLSSTRATAKQREVAVLAQQRIAIRRTIELRKDWATQHLSAHDIAAVRERIAQAMVLIDKLGDKSLAATTYGDIARAAGTVNEEELSIELYTKQVEKVPDRQRARTDLAWALATAERLDEAAAQATKALTLQGDTSEVANVVLAYAARAKNDFAAAEKYAQAAIKGRYAWPHIELARVEAVKGRWEEAVDHARKGLDLLPDQWEMQATYTAVTRGLQAHIALQANPSSARERLRLVRALAELGLPKQAGEEIAKLPSTGTWRTDGWWAIAGSADYRMLLADRAAAARNAKQTTQYRLDRIALVEARERLRGKPTDDDARIAVAKLYILDQSFHYALATIAPLLTSKTKGDVALAIAADARQGLVLEDQMSFVDAANLRADYATAIKLATDARAAVDKLGAMDNRIRIRAHLATALGNQGKFAEAIAISEEARKLALAHGDTYWIASLGQRIGSLQSSTGTAEAQRNAVAEALRICDEADDEWCLHFAYYRSSLLSLDDGMNAESLEFARKAWTYADRIGRADFARRARFQVIDATYVSGNIGEAEKLANDLLADARKAADLEHEHLGLMVQGAVAMSRANGKAARIKFQEAYDVAARAGRTEWRANARRLEGRSWMLADKDAKKAAATYEQAANLYATLDENFRDMHGGVLRSLAYARLMGGDVAGARKAAEQGIKLTERGQRRTQLVWNQWILARIALAENNADEALARATQAVTLAKQSDDPNGLNNAWHVLARARALKKQDPEAAEAYDRAIEQLERLALANSNEADRNSAMDVGETRQVYKDAVAHYIKMGKAKRAIEILDMSRDAELNRAFDPTKVKTKDPKIRAQLEELTKLRAQVKALEQQRDRSKNEAQIKAISQQIAKTQSDLKVLATSLSKSPQFSALAIEPLSLAEEADRLPPDSVAVEYFVDDAAIYAFVITQGLKQPTVVRINVTNADLSRTVAEFRAAIVQENEPAKARDKVEELGRKLEDWLLEPLRSHLSGAKTVIIVPFGPLYNLPFDALVVSEPGQPVRYALEDMRISLQNKRTLKRLLRGVDPRRTGSMLAVSNPDGSLSGAAREVSRITKTLPDARVLTRKDATVARFVEIVSGFRYIHLATHGVVENDPLKTYLKMADKKLHVDDISGLALETNEMVVLSACESATQAEATSMTEQISLATAFATAGSPTIVASLWEVGDDSTAELMATFYRALDAGSGDRLDALRNAKLNLLRFKRDKATPYAQPWHWASFQLIGEFRTPTK